MKNEDVEHFVSLPVAGPLAGVGVALLRGRVFPAVEGEWQAGRRRQATGFTQGRQPVSAGSRATQVLQETSPNGGGEAGTGAQLQDIEHQ